MRRFFLTATALIFCLPAIAMVCGLIPVRFVQQFSLSKLRGVTEAAPAPILGFSHLLDGSFQARAEPWLAERMGRPREAFIRINNGLAYLFGRSSAPSVVFGRDRTLFEPAYIDDWCRRDTELDAERLARRLREVQDRLRESGKAFFFLISPSKAAVYPDWLPAGCAPPPALRPYDRLLAAFTAANVAVVDASAILKAARKTQPWPVFGRDGIHWNELGAGLVAPNILAEIERQLGRPTARVAIAGVEVDSKPFDEENDLAGVLNLPFDLSVYPSPHPRFATRHLGRPPRVLIVGSSFTWQMFRLLGLEKAIGPSRQYFYFSRIMDYADGRFAGPGAPHQAAADLPRALPDFDTVVIEANEANLVSPHIEEFISAVLSLRPGPGRAGRGVADSTDLDPARPKMR